MMMVELGVVRLTAADERMCRWVICRLLLQSRLTDGDGGDGRLAQVTV